MVVLLGCFLDLLSFFRKRNCIAWGADIRLLYCRYFMTFTLKFSGLYNL
jgi:hypothetical protein